MLCEDYFYVEVEGSEMVLILVLMEDALRDSETIMVECYNSTVLILVLMEDALRELPRSGRSHVLFVLILVLMEDALRDPSLRRRSKRSNES